MCCPYSDEELELWDSVANPIGKACYGCAEWECEHNFNPDNPEYIDFDEEWPPNPS